MAVHATRMTPGCKVAYACIPVLILLGAAVNLLLAHLLAEDEEGDHAAWRTDAIIRFAIAVVISALITLLFRYALPTALEVTPASVVIHARTTCCLDARTLAIHQITSVDIPHSCCLCACNAANMAGACHGNAVLRQEGSCSRTFLVTPEDPLAFKTDVEAARATFHAYQMDHAAPQAQAMGHAPYASPYTQNGSGLAMQQYDAQQGEPNQKILVAQSDGSHGHASHSHPTQSHGSTSSSVSGGSSSGSGSPSSSSSSSSS